MPRAAGFGREVAVRTSLSYVGDGGDRDSGVGEVEGGAVGGVVVGEEDGA